MLRSLFITIIAIVGLFWIVLPGDEFAKALLTSDEIEFLSLGNPQRQAPSLNKQREMLRSAGHEILNAPDFAVRDVMVLDAHIVRIRLDTSKTRNWQQHVEGYCQFIVMKTADGIPPAGPVRVAVYNSNGRQILGWSVCGSQDLQFPENGPQSQQRSEI